MLGAGIFKRRFPMIKDFDTLYHLIRSTYPFDGETYPNLRDMNRPQRVDFAVRHILSHLVKQTGKIATVCEGADHVGASADEDGFVVQGAAVKTFINAVRLAEVLGIPPDEFLELVEEQLQKSTPSRKE